MDVRVLRYDDDLIFSSARDSLSDLCDQLTFCTSKEFARELLIKRHAVSQAESRERGRRLALHVTTALAFVDQALSARPEVASVSAYYAVLNLSKCFILASSLHARLNAKMQHGASYRTYAKRSHHLLTETIQVLPDGVLPTLYELITGAKVNANFLSVRDIFPYIDDTSAEWSIATGTPDHLATVDFTVETNKGGLKVPYAEVTGSHLARLTRQQVPLLSGFRRVPGQALRFAGTPQPAATTNKNAVLSGIRRHLLYDAHAGLPQTPVGAHKLQLPQELPIALAFFHLGSIARYNPEMLARIRDSRYWPLVVSAQWHALQKFLVLSWSYLQQRNVLVNAQL